jgi:hypothetical protein
VNGLHVIWEVCEFLGSICGQRFRKSSLSSKAKLLIMRSSASSKKAEGSSGWCGQQKKAR